MDITSDLIVGSYSDALNTSYITNGNLRINNGNLTYSMSGEVVEFKEGKVYKYDELSSKWVINKEYDEAFISKSNFREGNFKGDWNSGIFGTQDKRIKWEGYPATWNLGTLMNANWESGTMDSIYTLPDSHVSEFKDDLPYQKLRAPNNNGWGYNYVIDSDINDIIFNNGTIYNSILGNGVNIFYIRKS